MSFFTDRIAVRFLADYINGTRYKLETEGVENIVDYVVVKNIVISDREKLKDGIIKTLRPTIERLEGLRVIIEDAYEKSLPKKMLIK